MEERNVTSNEAVEKRKAISIEEIRVKAKGTLVEIPDWVPGQKIWVRVKAIDMTPHIMAIDSLPNKLKVSATEVFNGKDNSEDKIESTAKDIDTESMEKMMPIIDGVVKEVLVEPTYEEIEAIYPLTLGQKMELFRLSMGGIDKLDSFR